MRFRVIMSPDAVRDLHGIRSYMANEFAEFDMADAQIRRIGERIDSLEFFPMRYPLCHELLWCDKSLRSVPVDSYHIFYISDENSGIVKIVRIIHGSRDIRAVFRDYSGKTFLEV